MVRSLCASAAVGAVILVTGVSPALGAFPGKNGRIAFVSDGRGLDFDIWTASPDGSVLANLTRNKKADDFAPSWRADGRKLVFQSDLVSAANPEGDHEILVMNSDGSDKTQLTFNALDDEHPAWSPDGSRITFERDFDPVRGPVDYDLFTMHADGTGERRLTSSPGVQDLQDDWSQDGQTIAFLSDRDGDFEIYTMDPDGADVRQLTSNEASEFLPGWSPDGDAIVFTTDRDGNFEIYTTSPDGLTQTRLTFSDAGDGFPAWAPDGSQIIFASDRRGVLGASDLFTMGADGGDQASVTRFPGWDIQPDWQPVP
jgi:Tol biopolymer transport system component